MKRTIFLLIAITMTTGLFAQNENYEIAIDSFQANYNAKNYDKIFYSFSDEMQKALPIENTRQFFTNLLNEVGVMESKEFVKKEQGTVAVYKAQFERAVLGIYISLDNQNKINSILIKPYQEKTVSKSQTINALYTYPNEIAATIFEKAKALPNNTQLSIAIIKNDKTEYYGIIKQNDTIKAIENQNKIFEIDSITKVFTATVLATLVTKGKIKLNDHINSYYPFSFNNNIQLSFESLANHTSDLPRLPENLDLSSVENPYQLYDKNEIEDYLKKYLKLENDTLKSYVYSNLGAGLLGYTLGKSQNLSFQTLLQKKVFDKYKMKSSYTSSKKLNEKLVKGLDLNGNEIANWDFDALFGGGGILSSSQDLVKFAYAQFNPKNKELLLTQKPTFTVNEQMKIGLAWHIIKSEDASELLWHNGGTGGYTSSMIVDTNKQFSVIILSNASTFNENAKNIDQLAFELTKMLN